MAPLSWWEISLSRGGLVVHSNDVFTAVARVKADVDGAIWFTRAR